MGMKEKRAIKNAEESWLPSRQQELNQICGAELPYEIDWDSFADDEKAVNWLEHNGPHQVSAAFRGVCVDDVGREAVREGLKGVRLRNVAAVEDKRLVLEDGMLVLECAFAKSPAGRYSYKEIQLCLEEHL